MPICEMGGVFFQLMRLLARRAHHTNAAVKQAFGDILHCTNNNTGADDLTATRM